MEWVLFLKTSQGSFLALIGILGLIIGSFLNVVILRLPQRLHQQWTQECHNYLQEKVTSPPVPFKKQNLISRSQCMHCAHQLSLWENIPILSFMLLKRQCFACHKSISWRYPVIELATALFSVITAYYYGFSWQTAVALILTWILITLTVIDIEHQLLPDNITLPALWLGLIANLYSVFTDINHAIIGAIAGYLFLWSIYWLFKIITKKEGMGYGDFKLLAMVGAYLGWQALPGIVLISSVLGTLTVLSLIIFKHHQRAAPFPFGPFIAIAGWVMLIWGNKLNHFYLTFSGFA